MTMQNYDVIYIDDEPTMTDIFTQFVTYKFKHWRARAFVDSQEIYEKILSDEISAAVWLVDIMMPQKNGAQIAETITLECAPGTVILGYTALDPFSLESKPEYRRGLKHFTRIINKQENFSSVLELVDVWVKQQENLTN